MTRVERSATSQGGAGLLSGRAKVISVIVLCTTVVVSATIGEFALGVLAPAFDSEFTLAASQLGPLMGIMFVAMGVCAFPAGYLTDTVHPRTLVLVQVVLAALVFCSYVLASDAVHVAVTCALIGAVMSLNVPLTNRIVLEYLAPNDRASAIAWKSLGLQLAAVLAGLLLGVVGSFVPWRAVVLVVTALMLIFAAWAYRSFRRLQVHEAPSSDAPTGGDSVRHAPRDDGEGSYRIAAPIVWWMIPYMLLTIGAFTSVVTYLVLYGTNVLGMPAAEAALVSGATAAVSMAARFLWVRWLRPHNEAMLLIVAAVASAAAVALLAVAPTFGPAALWIVSLLLGATVYATTPLGHVILVRNTRSSHIGRVTSYVGISTAASLAGMPWAMSLFLDAAGFANTWLLIAACLLAGAALMGVFVFVRRERGTRVPAVHD